MTFIKVENNSLSKYFNYPEYHDCKEVSLELKNHHDYNAVITLSSNEMIQDKDCESMDKIEESIRRGIFYRVKIKTYINRRGPHSLKYDDFEFTQCMPDENVIPIIHVLLGRIIKMAELLNKKWYGWDH